MPTGTLDLMKLDGQPVSYQIMFNKCRRNFCCPR